MTAQYVFGPVPSRRLGQSLGIDTIPLKTCNWNCVYCQLGRTHPVSHQRRAYFPREEILAEVATALAAQPAGALEWVTFVGSGEPTLHSDIGWLIRQVKELTALPVAVITNGSLLYQPGLRWELGAADAVLPTLDAGTADLYRTINRPHPEATFERLVEGLIAFRESFHGCLWIEVMLLAGLNDTPQALLELQQVMRRIMPDEIHVLLPTRPPAESWVAPAGHDAIMRAIAILGAAARTIHPEQRRLDLTRYENPVEAVLAIIARHPLPEAELQRAMARWDPQQVANALTALRASGRARIVERYGVPFWTAPPAHFPSAAQSERTDPRRRRSQREVVAS